jgi:uncharacterized protein (TIGR02246 family)
MRRLLAIAALTFVVSASAFAQAGDIEKKIMDLEKQSREAAQRGDMSFLDSHATDDYMSTTAWGTVRMKADAMEDLKTGALKYASIQVDDPKVRVYGDDVAIVTGQSTIKATRDGQDISGQYRVTRVWIKKGGEWKLAAFHSSRIASATP